MSSAFCSVGSRFLSLDIPAMIILEYGHAVDIGSGTSRKYTRYTHARTRTRVFRHTRNMSRVGEGTNGNTGSWNCEVFPDCVDDYQRVNNYFAVQTCRFVGSMDGVVKHTTECWILSTSYITADIRILLTSDVTDFCTNTADIRILLTSDVTDFCTNTQPKFEYCWHPMLLTSVQTHSWNLNTADIWNVMPYSLVEERGQGSPAR
jgi:hypothetical protein